MWIKENGKDVWIDDREYLKSKTKDELIEIIYDLESQLEE